MRTKHVALLVVAVATVAAVVVAGGPRSSSVQARIGVKDARAASRAVPGPIAVRSLSDAIAFLSGRDAAFQAGSGLTRAAIALTSEIYAFENGVTSFARGLSAYRTPLTNGGFCITFANATSCSKGPPTHNEPVVGLGIDVDSERGGEPFVLVGVKASDVTSVTYTCAGQTYPATIAGDAVAFVAPSAELRPDDCVANASLRGGETVSVRV